MDEMTFGEILRETRERKGLDLNATARRLRIRPDILRAIEAGNFAAMPPRGYTRNMVNGYARYLGLNPTEITGMYIQELTDYQQGMNNSRRRSTGFDMSEAPDNNLLRGMTSRLRQVDTQTSSRRRSNESYADGLQSMESSRAYKRGDGRNYYPESRVRQSKGSVLPPSSFIDQRGGTGGVLDLVRERLPFIIAAVVVLIIVIVLANFLFGNKEAASPEAQETMPVTGVDSTMQTQPSDANQTTITPTPTVTETAPTKATFELKVNDGAETYLEVYVDGESVLIDTVSGPSDNKWEFSDTLQLVCADMSAVTATLDGEAVTLEENSSGIVNTTYRFSDVLAKWQSDHPGAQVATPAPTTSTDGASADGTADTTTDETGTDTTTEPTQDEEA